MEIHRTTHSTDFNLVSQLINRARYIDIVATCTVATLARLGYEAVTVVSFRQKSYMKNQVYNLSFSEDPTLVPSSFF